MKITRILIAGIVLVALSLSIIGCSGDNGTGAPSWTSSLDAASEFRGELENPVVKHLSDRNLNAEASVALQLFMENYGGTIEHVNTTFLEKFDALANAILTDNSPDLFDYHWNAFPHGMYHQQFEPLDDYVDIDNPIWTDIRPIMDQFKWKGEHYYLPVEQFVNATMHYDRDILVDKMGYEDPKDLYERGEWTWDTFHDMIVDFTNAEDGNIGYFGLSAAFFIASTGTTMVDVSPEGEIINNLRTPEIQRAMEFIEKCNKEKLFGDRDDNWRGGKALNDGNILFYGMGLWVLGGSDGLAANLPEHDLFFVPYPRDPSSDTYYHSVETTGFMVPKGAKNIEGASAFIICNRLENIDPVLAETARDRALNPEPEFDRKGNPKFVFAYTEEQYDFMTSWNEPDNLNFVFDHAYGFNQEMDDTLNEMLEKMLVQGGTWAEIREEYYPVIQNELDKYAIE